MATAALERGSLSERQSYVIVGAAHVVLLAALSLALRSATPPPPPDEGVPVEIVAATAPPTPPAPAPPQPAPAPQPTPEPMPAPKPEAKAPPPVDDTAPPAKIRPRPAKPEPKPLDTDALAKLLDKAAPKPKPLDTKALTKSLDAAQPRAKPLDTAALAKSLDAALPKAPALPKRGDPKVAAAIAAAIRAQVTPCWTLPVGGGTGRVTALLHIAINRDGSIAGRPGLVSQTGVTGANAAYARAFAEAASRAVLRCAPLKLPADQYDQWAQVEINFDPADF